MILAKVKNSNNKNHEWDRVSSMSLFCVVFIARTPHEQLCCEGDETRPHLRGWISSATLRQAGRHTHSQCVHLIVRIERSQRIKTMSPLCICYHRKQKPLPYIRSTVTFIQTTWRCPSSPFASCNSTPAIPTATILGQMSVKVFDMCLRPVLVVPATTAHSSHLIIHLLYHTKYYQTWCVRVDPCVCVCTCAMYDVMC